ncbi:hypothetical protein AGABI1DRAFT_117296 [Agaricus bisporus var. burnettii JB137-S8]|uniref:Peroxisomal membrane protein PEX14 n=1 Tax=Agaricus bisporus var. burnettii (strain JB137-S8 / ATCC MYA-4627 / FGSC 10392) TaxID=597362 RepID=K5Y6L7_AGABU|nr:uncharacterized protein AGABI1DRAFT_117296 [Agaricus bisporus var. burnettii JB137-S8]EKM83825.1 hypothetical protein AGABI1DRAFT_117296 [Agaricus bisporus var. burnettii JB137-S8]
MSSPDRQELLRNAVVFLQDPKTQASPFAQRIQFLEAKGLTPQEIDIAIKQSSSSTQFPNHQPAFVANYSQTSYPPGAQRWDWRDYFVTAVISGAITYGAISLFKKYLQPHLQPPTASAYEEDRDALNAQFDAAEALLKEIQNETTAVRAAVEEQKSKIDRTTQDVEEVVGEMRQNEIRTRDEMREVREEVNNIRDMLPKMIERNKEHHTQSLNELQQEMKSLKALLLNRPTGLPASPNPLLPITRPSIPAWQLASSTTSNTTPGIATPTAEPATVTPLSYRTDSPTPLSNGKGKEVDMDVNAVSSSASS